MQSVMPGFRLLRGKKVWFYVIKSHIFSDEWFKDNTMFFLVISDYFG